MPACVVVRVLFFVFGSTAALSPAPAPPSGRWPPQNSVLDLLLNLQRSTVLWTFVFCSERAFAEAGGESLFEGAVLLAVPLSLELRGNLDLVIVDYEMNIWFTKFGLIILNAYSGKGAEASTQFKVECGPSLLLGFSL